MWNRNSALLFGGRLLSNIGDSLYQVAVIWYIFTLTENTFYTGVATAVVMIPKILNVLFGPVIERMNKSRVLVHSQFIQFVLMLMIPLALYLGYESVYLVITIMFLVSFLENIEGTAEIALMPTVVAREHRGKFNSRIGVGLQLIDLSMKGLFATAILFFGIEHIYLFNAFTYLLAALLFSLIRVPFTVTPSTNLQGSSYRKELNEGLHYFFTTKIVVICAPFLLANFCFGITQAVLPAYAASKGGGEYYALMLMAITIGNLIGTIFVLRIMHYPLGRLLIVLPFLSSCLWMSSVFLLSPLASILVLGLAFIPFGMMSILLITFLQVSIAEHLLARVSSTLDSFLVAALPLGALLGGMLPQIVGVEWTMFSSALGLTAISFYFAMNKENRDLPTIEEISV
ncbi:MFS transporter [Exiguobacterium alkaliphilum]|uniref:MFS transporter n=1 Tax=Exiguobacterium alkaliphilum TaxID=1428684 RepID=A0ABT2KYK6_9BACL|nr:MFS transporter [Exiguobacterium alkaliphilum]MCT4796012.1 MFS transporter [Exiguobacterium alkaliphilum]